jgi:hypothetical protein
MSQQKDWLSYPGYSLSTKPNSAVWREREKRMKEMRRGRETGSGRMDKVIEFVESKSTKIGLLK